jgi:hypothetical protein
MVNGSTMSGGHAIVYHFIGFRPLEPTRTSVGSSRRRPVHAFAGLQAESVG